MKMPARRERLSTMFLVLAALALLIAAAALLVLRDQPAQLRAV